MMRRNRSRLLTRLKRQSRSLSLLVSLVFACLIVEKAISVTATPSTAPGPSAAAPGEPIAPLPLSLPLDPKRVALGERLFNDVRLSHDNNKSCAVCHPLKQGGMDGLPRAASSSGAHQLRNTPTIFNVGFNASFNWDGISNTLEAQTEIVLLNPRLMNTTWPELLAKLRADADYVAGFNAAYSGDVTPANVTGALASFLRSLLTPNARFDRHLHGERNALTAAEEQGYRLFKSYGCVACHQGLNIGGNMYQRFGVFEETHERGVPADTIDLGRYFVTRAPRDREVFRVPSLRNVAVTAPYFHDGRARTLEEAVTTMARVQLGKTLTAEEVGLIVRFLHTLTGEYQGRPVGTPLKNGQ
jgi:cytochrome c peroxidase